MASTPLVISTPDDMVRALLPVLPDDVEVIDWSMDAPPSRSTIDLVLTPYMSRNEKLVHLNGVTTRVVQGLSLGYDGVKENLPPGHVFANATGVHEASTAELTLALILASQRGIDDFVRASMAGTWAPKFYPSLADRTVLLVGYGGIGKAIDERLRPFEVNVLRAARTARRDERGDIASMAELPELLAHADIVVIGVPLNDETRGLVNDDFMSRMKDNALLVNVARGGVTNADDLLEHARRGRLRFALDVTSPEPLPSGHPLFSLSNVLISPHIGGASDALIPRMKALLAEQIRRLRANEPPLNVVLRS